MATLPEEARAGVSRLQLAQVACFTAAVVGLAIAMTTHVASWFGHPVATSFPFAAFLAVGAAVAMVAACILTGLADLSVVWRMGGRSRTGRALRVVCLYGFLVTIGSVWALSDAFDAGEAGPTVEQQPDALREPSRSADAKRLRWIGVLASAVSMTFFAAAAVQFWHAATAGEHRGHITTPSPYQHH